MSAPQCQAKKTMLYGEYIHNCCLPVYNYSYGPSRLSMRWGPRGGEEEGVPPGGEAHRYVQRWDHAVPVAGERAHDDREFERDGTIQCP